jgi:hypothetical protein
LVVATAIRKKHKPRGRRAKEIAVSGACLLVLHRQNYRGTKIIVKKEITEHLSVCLSDTKVAEKRGATVGVVSI